MKKNILFIFSLLAATGVSMMTTSCSDEAKVQDITLSQALSPTSLTMEAKADLSVDVSWNLMFNATGYELVVSKDPNFVDATQEVYNQTKDVKYVKGSVESINITGLEPETAYFARLKSVNSSITASKYVYADVVTVAEQIMNVISKADITYNSVKISWTAGEFVKAIEVIDVNGSVVSTLTPSAADIAAGTYTITGLSAHTTYTIRLVSDKDKTRGIRTFTTLLDLSTATTITATQGADGSWAAIVEGAAAGSVFALEAGDYVTNGAALKISSNVTLAAKDITKKPVIYTQFQIDGNASLYCYYVDLNANMSPTDETTYTDQCFNFKSTGATGSLDAEGCTISNYQKGLVYINTATVVNEINIKECTIKDIPCNGGDFIDSRSGSWNTLNFMENTVIKCFLARDFLRSPKSAVATGLSNVENNTFYNCGSTDAANYRFFYTQITGAQNNFKNNIVSGFIMTRGFGNTAGLSVTFDNNVYFECLNLTELAEGNTQALSIFDTKGQVLTATPFVDAANGDFRLTDANLRLKKVGPASWYNQTVD